MKKSLLFFALVLASYGTIQAQVTTSSMSGIVTESSGHATVGATIKAIHLPSGTAYSGSANSTGRFNLANMRVGGPYRVEVTYVGQTPVVYEDVYLQLGQAFVLNPIFGDATTALEEVSVTGRQGKSNKNGTSTVVNRMQIENMPSISRSINDFTRLTPQANGNAIGGGNYRSNVFTVDGANFSDQFGIGGAIPGGGSPISLDAIEQISVNVTPYDVRQSGFTGAAINAVTRSGRNDFFVTAFYTGRTQNQQGTRVNDVATPIADLKDKNFGFSLGGPIIKDKLFFFVNAERNAVVKPGPTKVASSASNPFGSASYIAKPSEDFLNEVSAYLKNTYSYDTGPYQGYSNKEKNDKIFARIDWNINENHKINARYSQVKTSVPSDLSPSTGGSGIPNFGTNRTNINALHFQNSNYFQESNMYSGTIEYLGKTGQYNHSARASYIHQNEPRTSGGSLFPLVDILDGTPDKNVLTTFGYEPFTYGNLRDVKTMLFNYDVNRVFGEHNVTMGAQYETSITKNGFQRFGAGYYVYASWNDFKNNATPFHYALTYPLTEDGSQAFPSFKFNQYSFYLQDEYTVTPNLKLTAGVRLELPTYPQAEEIKTHPLVEALKFPSGEIINTGALPKSRVMVAPRFGFNYDVFGDRTLQIRGGSGVFTGRIPFVWIVSQSSDNQLLQATVTNTKPSFSPDITANYPENKVDATKGMYGDFVSVMSPDLKFPSTWKSSLAVDYRLPFGIDATIEGIYNKDINAAIGRRLNFVEPTAMNVAGLDDHRMLYPRANADKYIYKKDASMQLTQTGTSAFHVNMLENAKGGHYWSAMIQLSKRFDNGFSGSLAYVRSGARNFHDGGGSQLASYWEGGKNYNNPNVPELGYTDNVLPNRLVGSLSYANSWIKDLKTSVTIFYEGADQGRYSYFYSGDFNGDTRNDNDLMFIPENASQIKFVDIVSGGKVQYTAQQQSDRFFELVEGDDYLKSRKGKNTERNGGVLPWRNQFDLRISQELIKNIGGVNNSLQVFCDIFNVGNLVNRSWGVRHLARGQMLNVRNANALTPGGTVAPEYTLMLNGTNLPEKTYITNETISSTYYMQFGVRFNFN
ncbi:MAG: TonB-dependent receptor [Sphingobacterium sp.]|nr:TonB-dependent receptor [Sphingobacterium sp.]